MPCGIDLVHRKFGKLRVVRETAENVYLCQCDCGGKVKVFRSQLTKGAIRFCRNCQRKATGRVGNLFGHLRLYKGRDGRRHQKASGEYLSWCACKERCFTKTNGGYSEYGGRGITVCTRWTIKGGKGFRNFIKDMGPRGACQTLDRINVQSHYMPGNCRWADIDVQNTNQRRWLFPDGNEPPVAAPPPTSLDLEMMDEHCD